MTIYDTFVVLFLQNGRNNYFLFFVVIIQRFINQ